MSIKLQNPITYRSWALEPQLLSWKGCDCRLQLLSLPGRISLAEICGCLKVLARRKWQLLPHAAAMPFADSAGQTG